MIRESAKLLLHILRFFPVLRASTPSISFYYCCPAFLLILLLFWLGLLFRPGFVSSPIHCAAKIYRHCQEITATVTKICYWPRFVAPVRRLLSIYLSAYINHELSHNRDHIDRERRRLVDLVRHVLWPFYIICERTI